MKKFYDVIWRFCVACSVIATLVGLSIAATNSNYTSVRYSVFTTDLNNRIELDAPCGGMHAGKYFDYKTTSGKTAYVTLCFIAHPFTQKNGEERMLVPYKVNKENDYWWGNTPYSNEVVEYTNKAALAFKMTKEEEKSFESKYWSNKWHSIGEAVGVAFALNAIFWALFYVMVWVFTGNKKNSPEGLN